MEKTSEKIVAYIQKKEQVSAHELTDFLLISERAVFKQLSNLLEEGRLTKIGKPPKVYYRIAEREKTEIAKLGVARNLEKIINENFLIITPSGERKQGMEGFAFWCQKVGQPIAKTAVEYAKVLKKYSALKKDGAIDGMKKMHGTFKQVYLDNLFYLDFYSIERFGKTKLGQLLLYAKQSQDKKLMRELSVDIKPEVDKLMKKYAIDAVGFIPPTVKRQVQFMKELENYLHPMARKIAITKIKTPVIVPQKTLNKLEDRIENARRTIIVNENNPCKNILLIDDAVGSGATLNETAGQIRRRGICSGKIIGLSITGSAKGFDVISEV